MALEMPAGLGEALDERTAAAKLESWLQRFADSVSSDGGDPVDSLFVEDAWWRDLLTLSWDIRTFAGATEITRALEGHQTGHWGSFAVDLGAGVTVAEGDGPTTISGFFTFVTHDVKGRGFVRLFESEGRWRAWTLLTQVDGFTGVPEPVGVHRPLGLEPVAVEGRDSWWDAARRAEVDFADGNPDVVIIGAGQAGLSLAARLKVLGVPTLVLESNQRVGDNWRKRYPSLTLHDPIWVNRLPYLDYPATWPVFMPRTKFAGWLESYVDSMDLNVWTGCADTRISRGDTGQWTVEVTRDGARRVLHPRDVVVATGLNGAAHIPDIPGLAEFEGVVSHSSAFAGARDWRGKRAIVVGAGTSAHDIAQDLCEQGAEVTLVQRSTTLPVRRDVAARGYAEMYDEAGPPISDADMMMFSVPWNLLVEMQSDDRAWRDAHADLIADLERTEYKVEYGGGVMARYLSGVNGYYLDVGALRLIADGKIRVKQGVQIESVSQEFMSFADGEKISADLIVFATGYGPMEEAVRAVVGDAADGIESIHRLDDEGELTSVWRPTGVPGLWIMLGNILMARYFSRILALQIKARHLGLVAD
ncbi:NAD(P)/FAD-dependent oxidoreductase [Amycolatopsis sp. GM8]|uniref:flavin-containing monooxygenase n=1 Tax=Amycolatopsis sp. GM8 TaxID=2896530 RepID=UPI001F376894|nr:NAD(P)/FAD-dependent oxidoreductase [Amycolatopsis sp. GM8]